MEVTKVLNNLIYIFTHKKYFWLGTKKSPVLPGGNLVDGEPEDCVFRDSWCPGRRQLAQAGHRHSWVRPREVCVHLRQTHSVRQAAIFIGDTICVVLTVLVATVKTYTAGLSNNLN